MSLDHSAGFGKQQKVTDDAFLGGRLTLAQPERGFRAGLDSVLLGAGIAPDSRSLLDLGAGVGTAGLCALSWNPTASATLAEIDAQMVALAQQNAARNGMADRCDVIGCDVTASGSVREAAGIRRDHYQSVIANPPFFEADGGTRAPDRQKATARHMPIAELDKWVKTAAATAAPRGEVIFINRADLLTELLASFSARLGSITVLPLHPRPGEAATRVLVRGIKGSRAPLTLLPPLILHGETGHEFAPDIADILMGRQRLVW